MPFALDSHPEISEISEAINYLLGNFGANLSADPNTGEIKGPTGNVIAYLYKYLSVKYADSADGALNFSDSPTNRQYYGLRNSDQSVESTNPADYIWKQVAGGFGTTKFLWYQTGGGRQVEFFVGTAAPNSYFVAVPSPAIDLDIVTGSSGQQYALAIIYQWTASSTPPARPSTTSTYTWSTGTFTAPSGWSTSIPSAPGGGYYLWSISVPLVALISATTSVIDWTSTSYPITAIGITGTAGSTGPRTSTGYVYYQLSSGSPPTAPTLSGFNFVTGQFSSISANWSTNFNAPAATDTTKFWAVYYSVSESTFGGAQTVTVSSVFNWTNFNGLVTFTNLATNTGTTFIDGGNIITDTLTVDKISSGTTTFGAGNSFSLDASGISLNGFTAIEAVKVVANKWGIISFQEAPGSDQCAAIAGSTLSNGAYSVAGFAAFSTAYNSFYTSSALANNFYGYSGRYNRSIGTPNNQSLIPVNSTLINGSDNAGYFAYYGSTASNRVAEAYIANTSSISSFVGRRYNTSGTTLINEIFLNNASYSAQSTTGAIFSAGGYLPFTGVHDGLIEESEGLVVGDIVVDYEVEAVLNPSNVVMLYKKSSVANQKGAIGVCIQIYDTPPTDWNEYETTGEVDPVTGKPIPDPAPIPNPMYYPIPAGQKVIHVNALGEGTINVTGEGGDIEIGDLIVTSSTPGKGMKQSDDIVRSITVAKSRQTITFNAVDQVKTIACIYLGG